MMHRMKAPLQSRLQQAVENAQKGKDSKSDLEESGKDPKEATDTEMLQMLSSLSTEDLGDISDELE